MGYYSIWRDINAESRYLKSQNSSASEASLLRRSHDYNQKSLCSWMII